MDRSNVTITLYMSELIYDIQNKTYLTGRSRKTGQNHEEVANMQANDDDENLGQLQRSIQNAYASMKMQLSEYLATNQSASDNELMDDEDELHITLQMPTNYNHSTVDTISSALHQYIVNISISEWFTITNKADVKDYVSLASANLEQVREAINKRVRPTRRGADNMGSRYEVGTAATPAVTVSDVDSTHKSVTMATATRGASIHYTTDGRTPTAASPVYNGALTFEEDTLLKAVAVMSGMYDSAVAVKQIEF